MKRKQQMSKNTRQTEKVASGSPYINRCGEYVGNGMMTYHEDVAAVKDRFKKMLEDGVYKADLFADL